MSVYLSPHGAGPLYGPPIVTQGSPGQYGYSKSPDTKRRQVEHVPPPIVQCPTDEEFFIADVHASIHRPNLDLLKHQFLNEGRLTEEQALFILDQTTQLLSQEPNMLHARSPVVVCGDIHGQFYDLLKILELGGSFAENNYLFLGDYVDRGYFSIECLLYLYALKLWYPTQLLLLRGNHECRHLTEYFTFKRECMHKYSATIYDACIQSFQSLPVAALIDGKFFCVHGGISPELQLLEDVDKLNRFAEPDSQGLLCDLLWADPVPNFGTEHDPAYEWRQGTPLEKMFYPNHTRGCSYYYTYEAVCSFLERNQLLGMFRGHEAQDAGYTMHRKTASRKFPSVITVFSAPNYLDLYHNKGAIIKYNNKNMVIRQYYANSHPYWLPNFMDAFTWSLPFVGSKITEMLLAILSVCSDRELEESSSLSSEEEDAERARALTDITEEEDEEDETRTIADLALTPDEISERRQQIKSKIMAVGRMQRVFRLLREEAENATELHPSEQGAPTAWPGGFAAPETLGVRTIQARRYIRSFDDARQSDIANERLPKFDYRSSSTLPFVPVPSMRLPGLPEDGDRGNLEALIRGALEEEGLGDGGVVERLADRIARGRRSAGRPRALKRYETA
ncbi:Metallo-dependent phosphatase-like protein [Sparassis latifolia]|uniref:Serine/threonine-protein phosphatase n=1 Tax=Sparassis crispa TaxID=139825 RepID=A0A401GQQ1_9APHY|nr:Serine/threonine-protein phosphatase 2B catalytic subunit A1 [Sparassis crispa]GBE84489.1 Serine/threonine-protein phosphatase 2B catalytic subunit A1 [Sparassis crispa]